MCQICENNYNLPTEPGDYYFHCQFMHPWHGNPKIVPVVVLNPVEYYDAHRMQWDSDIGLKFYGLGGEYGECRYNWDTELNPVSNALDMYDKLVEWGFKYSPSYVRDMREMFKGCCVKGRSLTTKMVKEHCNK